jgi:hypothetical protein
MEKEQAPYLFAKAVIRMGVDFLNCLGINLLWIGVESKAGWLLNYLIKSLVLPH